MVNEALRTAFVDAFDSQPSLWVHAPGRVNLIGDTPIITMDSCCHAQSIWAPTFLLEPVPIPKFVLWPKTMAASYRNLIGLGHRTVEALERLRTRRGPVFLENGLLQYGADLVIWKCATGGRFKQFGITGSRRRKDPRI